jgi:N-acetylmuramoyl-L-alanine amidase
VMRIFGAKAFFIFSMLLGLALPGLGAEERGNTQPRAGNQPGAQVTKVQYVAGEGSGQVQVELSEAVASYQSFSLPSDPAKGLPARIYVDLAGTRLAKGGGGAAPADNPCIQQIRVGQFDLGVVRVVLDMKTACEARVSLLTAPSRLVVEVRAPNLERARAAQAKEKTLPRQKPAPAVSGLRKIVLDPGHGGKDTGAIGVSGLMEKDVVLAVAKKLAGRLRSEMGIEVVLTRENDTFIPLEERTAIANRQGADLFVSLHTNASPNPQARGIETYYLNNTDDEAARRLAARENGTSYQNVSDIQLILSDLIQSAKLEDSISLAHHLQSSLIGTTGKRLGEVRDLGVKPALFYVLVGARMPAVLAEIFFISNKSDALWLAGDSNQDGIVEGLFQGIKRFAQSNPAGKSL